MTTRLRRLAERSRANDVPLATLAPRVAFSILRRRFDALSMAAVTIDSRGTRVRADLRTPLGLALYRYGFSPPEARLVQMILRPGDVFLDGGANVGLFTLIAAAAVGTTGRVIACEPVPETIALLKANVGLNRFHWVEAYDVALGEAPGDAELFSFGPGAGLSSFAPESRAGSVRLPVRVVTLDALISSSPRPVRLVKLDIEGAEGRALLGAEGLLQSKPDFLIEVEPSHLARQGSSPRELQAIFVARGYQGYEIQEAGAGIRLHPLASWDRRPQNPNVFISARPPESLPAGVHVG